MRPKIAFSSRQAEYDEFPCNQHSPVEGIQDLMAMASRPFRRPRNAPKTIATYTLILCVMPLAQGQETTVVVESGSPTNAQSLSLGQNNSLVSPGATTPDGETGLLQGLPTVPSWYHDAQVQPLPVQAPAASDSESLQLDPPIATDIGVLPLESSSGSSLANCNELGYPDSEFQGQTWQPWWNPATATPLMASLGVVRVELAELMQLAAQNSNRVLAVAQTPWIRGEEYLVAQAALDPSLYMQTRYDDTSDPVGDTLTTGGPDRLFENRWGMEAGVRGTTKSGATYSVGQQLGHLNSNSQFISPNDQGSARLGASVSQPLLRNARIDINRSLILTTRLETDAAQASYLTALVEQLQRVSEAYWRLYSLRATLLQRQEHLHRAQQVAETLLARKSLDSSRNQVLRATAAIASREAAVARIEAAISNTENLLRTLINTQGISDQSGIEIIPMQAAQLEIPAFDVTKEVAAALQRRPELSRLHKQLDAAQVQYRLAQNQTKPELNLIVEGYVAGLQGRSDVSGAWVDQFTASRPGYAGGLEFEVPYRNRAAQAQLRVQAFEVRRIENLLAEQRTNIRAEVENSIRSLEAARREVQIRRRGLAAVREELVYQRQRWEKLQGDPRVGQFQLDELLGTQDRLFQEEQALLQALTDLNSALIDVQVSTGALVKFSQ
ncbi:MAG: TolC family protein [Aureliella sp.]